MTTQRVRPAEGLRAYVAGVADYDMAGWPPGRHRGLPDGSLNLLVHLGRPPIVRRAGRGDVAAVATVSGLETEPVDILHHGTQRGVQVSLTPRGARALLGLPAAAIAHEVVPLDEVVGRRAAELVDRLVEASGPAERARTLDAVLAGWVDDVGYPSRVDAAWSRLVATGGAVAVAAVADETGVSRRHLRQVVLAELGVTPKAAARVLRFARAGRSLRTGRTTSLADTAAACGYFDQSHLSHDWKRLAGCTPGQWIAEELPFLQDRDDRDEAG